MYWRKTEGNGTAGMVAQGSGASVGQHLFLYENVLQPPVLFAVYSRHLPVKQYVRLTAVGTDEQSSIFAGCVATKENGGRITAAFSCFPLSWVGGLNGAAWLQWR